MREGDVSCLFLKPTASRILKPGVLEGGAENVKDHLLIVFSFTKIF